MLFPFITASASIALPGPLIGISLILSEISSLEISISEESKISLILLAELNAGT